MKIFSMILPFSMVFAFYTLPLMGSLGPLILYIAFLVMISFDVIQHQKIRFGIRSDFKHFLVYILISQPIIFIVNGGFDSSRLINIVTVLVMTIILSYVDLDKEIFYKSYMILGSFAATTIFIQFVQIFFLKKVVHQIMLLPIDIYSTWYSEGIRPTGIFPEPAAYGTFIVLLIYLMLRKEKYLFAILFTISVFMSTSSLGIIVAGYMWLSEMVRSDLKLTRKIILLTATISFVIVLLQTNLFDYSIDKIAKTDFMSNVRLTRGFIIFEKLDFFDKIFGIGVNNLNYYLENSKIYLTDAISVGMRNKAYITGIFQVLIFYGSVGLILYLILIYKLFDQSPNKDFVISFILISGSSSFLFNTNWLVYMIVLLSQIKESRNKAIDGDEIL